MRCNTKSRYAGAFASVGFREFHYRVQFPDVLGQPSSQFVLPSGPDFFILCVYENDNSPVKFNEPPACPRIRSHPALARLLCAFAASASDLPRRLLDE